MRPHFVGGLLSLASLLASSRATAAGKPDFNSDGYADLAIGIPGKLVNELSSAGAVLVLYGSPTGLSAASAEMWSQHTSGILGTAETQDRFGSALAWGDLDGDGYTDLVVGAPDEDYGDTDDGVIHVIYGSASGLTSAGDQMLGQSDTGVLSNQFGDRFGAAVAVGDFDRDGYADVAVGAPSQDLISADNGIIAVLYGGAAGLAGAGNQGFRLDHFGLSLGLGDEFGSSFATGDFNGDARTDLAIGAPGRSHDGSIGAGTVVVAYGSATGVVSNGAQIVQENTGAGNDAYEYLGFSLASGDFDGNGKSDLAIGAPGQTISGMAAAGKAVVLMGKAGGLDLASPRVFHQNTVLNGTAIKDQAEWSDAFGWSLGTGDFNGDKRSDLLVGVPDEDNLNEDGVTVNQEAGQVHMILGSKTGLTAVGNKVFYQGTNGIDQEVNEDEDFFGTTLASGDFNNDGKSDAMIGIPSEDDGFYNPNEGAVMILNGSARGLDKSTHVVYQQDDLGFVGVRYDRFGGGVYGP